MKLESLLEEIMKKHSTGIKIDSEGMHIMFKEEEKDKQNNLIEEILNGGTFSKEYDGNGINLISKRLEYSLSRKKILDLLKVSEEDRVFTHIVIE